MLISFADRRKALLEKLSRDISNKGKKTFTGKRALDLHMYPSIPVYDIRQGEKMDEGVFICTIDILPWIVKSSNHPDKETPPGYDSYFLPYYAHRGVGPTEDEVLCLKRTYGENDPICIDYKNFWDSGDRDAARKVMPSYRVAYNVYDCNHPELGLQFFLNSGKNFHMILMTEIGLFEKKIGKRVNIFDIDCGYSVRFRATETHSGEFNYFKFSNFEFLERPPYKEEIYDKTIALEEMLVILSYEEIDNLYHGKPQKIEDKASPDKVENVSPLPPVEERKKREPLAQEGKIKEPNNAKGLCPFGHVFGVDIDNYEEHCAICDVYENCANELDKARFKK